MALITALFGLITSLGLAWIAKTVVGVKQELKQELTEVKESIAPLAAGIDGAQDAAKTMLTKIATLEGIAEGIATEKATQAVKDAATVAALASVSSSPPTPNAQASVPTAANPLLTEDAAKELLSNQTVIADKGRGWTEGTESPERER